MYDQGMHPIRTARTSDIDAVVATVTSAFFDDPVWGSAFPDSEHRAAQASAFWKLLAVSAQRYPWTFVTDGIESVALWIPPGGHELTSEEEAGLEDFLVESTDRRIADGILAALELFEAETPSEPHYYLSLLATHPDHRGHGTGMSLLRENLERIDREGAPAYLESTNPANLRRYESVGFVPRGGFTVASGQVVTTMWRPGR
jgi:GNAT superfamily N-acetyltransferase